MKYLALLLVGCLSMTAHAEIKETTLPLPDKLGNAILFMNPAIKPEIGVIVVHEWWGLNNYARSRAIQLAKLGYAAIAVDMYGTGKTATHPKEAEAFMNAAFAEPEKMNARFQGTLTLLEKNSGLSASHIYAIGYCFGGAVVLNQARMGTDLAGVASFHGMLATHNPAQAGKVKAKVFVATGGADPMVPAEQVGAFTAEMQSAGVNLQLLSFPGVKHGFTNPGATALGEANNMPLAYDANADMESWDALLKFLR